MTRISVLKTQSEFAAIREQWNTLLLASHSQSPFLCWEWLYSWWKIYGEARQDHELHILIAYEDNEAKAILPGYIHSEGHAGKKTFSFLATQYETSDYLEVISEQKVQQDYTCKLLEHLLTNNPDIAIVDLQNISTHSEFATTIKQWARQQKYTLREIAEATCPCISIQGEFSDFLKTLPRRRSELGRKTRRMQEKFSADISYIQNLSELEHTMDKLFQLHELRLGAKQGSTKFNRQSREAFHLNISQRFLENDILRLFTLKVDGEILAVVYGFKFKNAFYGYQTGMDPDWSKHSPLFVLWAKAIEYSFETNLNIFDFMRGEQSYKSDMTGEKRYLTTFRIATNPTGKFLLLSEAFILNCKNKIKQLLPKKLWQQLLNIKNRLIRQ